ncbi:hypothetical protein [Kribbella sp. CA-247076]|uniref:hypothetical protein n=1 Tax=Kribbella sp. CA-247076 TaxID=3239941 RepID=UPI003D8E179B
MSRGRFGGSTPYLTDGVPVLSVGSHRNPRDGACFMEYAGYLAGEPWSDHPRCTHPLLAHLARAVNDRTSDAGRGALAPMIPSVIGLTSDDPAVHPRLVARVVRTALPLVARQDQMVLAVALIRAQQMIAELEDGSDDSSRRVLDESPLATGWVASFLRRRARPRLATYLRRAAPNSISAATYAASETTHAAPDDLLRQMLANGIETLTQLTPERSAAPTSVASTQ